MHTLTRSEPNLKTTSLDVRVDGPDVSIPPADLRRLFPGAALTQGRLDRLSTWPRVIVYCGPRIVALATCQKTETEMRVPEIGIDADGNCTEREIVNVLLDALELAGLAAGCRRLVIMPPRVASAYLDRRGYTGIAERCAGGWLEKALL